jgi:hypothetical protein
MYRPAAAHEVRAGQDRAPEEDLEQDWSARHRAVAVVRVAPGRAPLQRVAAAAATERRAARRRADSPGEEDS